MLATECKYDWEAHVQHSVKWFMRKYELPRQWYEDLCQEGRLAAIKALRKYREDGGASVKSYIFYPVRNALFVYLYNNSTPLTVKRSSASDIDKESYHSAFNTVPPENAKDLHKKVVGLYPEVLEILDEEESSILNGWIATGKTPFTARITIIFAKIRAWYEGEHDAIEPN